MSRIKERLIDLATVGVIIALVFGAFAAWKVVDKHLQIYDAYQRLIELETKQREARP